MPMSNPISNFLGALASKCGTKVENGRTEKIPDDIPHFIDSYQDIDMDGHCLMSELEARISAMPQIRFRSVYWSGMLTLLCSAFEQ